MDKAAEHLGKITHRRLSSLKLIVKLLEDEVDLAKSDKEVLLTRGLLENLLDTVEVFIEDFEGAYGIRSGAAERNAVSGAQPAVTRLN